MERLIFHVDVNSAFLSWEAARRTAAGEEDIRLIPSAIGGDRDKRTGVILAKSIPAKKYGVKTGEPVSMALRKCPGLFLAKPDFRLYEKNSRAFMDICRSRAPLVEKYSIDECFMDMSGTGHMYPDPMSLANQIREEIRDSLGFTVNIGLGPNKLLAKMASDFEKPDRVHTLFAAEIETKLWPKPVGELFSVGRSTAERLEKGCIRTIGQLAGADLRYVQSLVGQKLGRQIYDYANGRDSSPVLPEPEEAKCYGNSTTLEEDVTDMDAAGNILMALCDSAASRMRADGARAACVCVTIRANDFKNRSHQCRLENPTDISAQIFQTSKQLFAELWDRRTPLRLLGVTLSEISREGYDQLSLFGGEGRGKSQKLDRAMDAIRSRYGSGAIARGAVMESGGRVGRKFKAQQDLKREE